MRKTIAGTQKFWFALCAALCLAAPARADQGEDFLVARDAYASGNIARLDQYARRLQGYVLEPYVAYWQLRARLDDAPPETVRAFIWRTSDTLLAERMRGEWLKALARKKQWELFHAEFPQLRGSESVELACYALQGRLRNHDDTALIEARGLWFSAEERPDSCAPLFAALFAHKTLGSEDIWQRLRLALEAGNLNTAKRVIQYLPANLAPNPRLFKSIASQPERYLAKPAYSLKTRPGHELTLFALYRLARNEPRQALTQWNKLAHQFSAEEQQYVWGQLAYNAAQKHEPGVLDWFAKVPANQLNDQQLGWKARAALRALNWAEVLDSINSMTVIEARESAWRYWKARALRALGKTVEGDAILRELANDHYYYGQLASEELGATHSTPAIVYQPSEQELTAIEQLPSIQRALTLYRLQLRFEGNLEWQWAIRAFDDRQLLAAAEIARRNQLYERAIFTANQTLQLHDFSLRYLAPYHEYLHEYVRQSDLDEAWVYGVIRQESRFELNAHSNAGARGLMQLMPATAKWVARRIGNKGFRQTKVHDLDINLNLGTYYLKHILDLSGGQLVLASAAYNAGPTRARQWSADVPLEGAIYVETIPLNETRAYVKKVLSNTLYYAQALGQPPLALKGLLGTIPPRGQSQALRDER
ncbi:MAG: transglycosylase SLT domain-containing protein [Burkholderiales bacterium]